MGVSHTAQELGLKLGAAAAITARAYLPIVKECSLVTKAAIQSEAPARLRNVGKSGSKLSVAFNIGEYPDGAKSLIFAKGKGWPIIENDTRAHAIPRYAGQRKGELFGPAFGGLAKRKKVLKIGDGFAAHVRSPGTKGKHPFAKGLAAARSTYGPIQRRVLVAELGAVL